ncbi:protein LEAD-SENSITIVE 1-like [Arachis stenosperma]|uniref:protein LEAD-SENSITIVE 1-like n=1 Tax=Arachis stenosperma TaxID=217475 RepID=UPI0025AC485A|nr:protein LEAD-SENSITIVE 1-like [Arachis stenosperma]
MGQQSSKETRESLKPGDHIYTWRTAYLYAHHGIYIGEETVIHFTVNGQSSIRTISSSANSIHRCQRSTCKDPHKANGVVSSCLDCFLAGGDVCRYEYDVSQVYFFVRLRAGMCTFAASDEDEIIVRRAKYLLEKGFPSYNLFKNNCENFAVYCKTRRVDVEYGEVGQSGQINAILPASLRIFKTDIGLRNLPKLEPEELAATLQKMVSQHQSQ